MPLAPGSWRSTCSSRAIRSRWLRPAARCPTCASSSGRRGDLGPLLRPRARHGGHLEDADQERPRRRPRHPPGLAPRREGRARVRSGRRHHGLRRLHLPLREAPPEAGRERGQHPDGRSVRARRGHPRRRPARLPGGAVVRPRQARPGDPLRHHDLLSPAAPQAADDPRSLDPPRRDPRRASGAGRPPARLRADLRRRHPRPRGKRVPPVASTAPATTWRPRCATAT